MTLDLRGGQASLPGDRNRNADTALKLLLQGRSAETVLDHCSRRLQPLLFSDKQKKTEYVKTLRTYLENNNDLLHTSKVLYVHRNTVIQRMKKISELLGVNVNDPAATNEFYNIFQILDYFQ